MALHHDVTKESDENTANRSVYDECMPHEVWQRGPIAGYPELLMPVAHSLLQVKEDLDALSARLSDEHLWARPAGAASVGFHLRHLGGSTDRLMTYARGEGLTAEQLEAGKRESVDTLPLQALVSEVHGALDRALAQVAATDTRQLLDARKVGRAGLPSNVLGLLFHVAEHATRHMGQAITTARIVLGK
jgi:uncharacterized damage-inducible protein DinB